MPLMEMFTFWGNIVHFLLCDNRFFDGCIGHTACTSDDPTNHQGDTCPIHEK